MLSRFNHKANSYSQAAIVQRDLAAWLAEWLEPTEQTAPLNALEFGPGDGLFTQFLHKRFAHLTAVDLAPQMAERGKRKLPQVEWRVGNAWSFNSPPVDRFFSASLLQWCNDPTSVLRHWRTLAKQNARMLHGFYVAPTLAEWQTLAKTQTPITWRSPEEWQEFFREAGWTVLRSESQVCVQQFSSAIDLLRFLHQTGAVTLQQTPVGKLRRMIAEYDHKFASADGTSRVTSTWTFFRIEAINP